MTCECGCGESAVSGSFRPGHDQKLRTELERRVGGLRALKNLVETAESFVAGQTTVEALAHRIRIILKAAEK